MRSKNGKSAQRAVSKIKQDAIDARKAAEIKYGFNNNSWKEFDTPEKATNYNGVANRKYKRKLKEKEVPSI